MNVTGVAIIYLRITRRKNRDGSTVEYYQLAHHERDPVSRKPVAHIIHDLGLDNESDREQLIRFCQYIARVCGLKNVYNPLNEKAGSTVTIEA